LIPGTGKKMPDQHQGDRQAAPAIEIGQSRSGRSVDDGSGLNHMGRGNFGHADPLHWHAKGHGDTLSQPQLAFPPKFILQCNIILCKCEMPPIQFPDEHAPELLQAKEWGATLIPPGTGWLHATTGEKGAATAPFLVHNY